MLQRVLFGLLGLLAVDGVGGGAAHADVPTTLIGSGVTQVAYPGQSVRHGL